MQALKETVCAASCRQRATLKPDAHSACAALLQVATKIGRAVAQLHDGGVVHGDLTTSNMILREPDGMLVR